MSSRKRSQAGREGEEDTTSSSPVPNSLALRRLLYVLMVGDPAWTDDRWDFLSTIGVSDISDRDGRVWWRVPRHASDSDGWDPGYVSLRPAEFRLQPPNGSRDIIRDAPVSDRTRPLSELLKRELRILEAHADPQDEELMLLKQSAQNVLRYLETGTFAEGLDIFRGETMKLGIDETTSAQDVVNRLFADCLIGFRLPGALYALAMTLLQIQMGANLWIEQDIYTDVRNFLGSFLRETSKSEPVILEAAVKIGNRHFDDGRNNLKSALSSVTLENFYRQLYIAAHHFFAACAIAKDTEGTLTAGRLNYTALVAEESWVCIKTGLSVGLEDFVDGNRYGFEERLMECLELNGEDDAQSYLRDLTRPTNPVLPKHQAHVALARAMVRSGGHWLQKGVEGLRSLEEEFYSRVSPFENSSHELNNIQLGLMFGYRKLGDEKRFTQYAAKMAGRVIIERQLMNWH